MDYLIYVLIVVVIVTAVVISLLCVVLNMAKRDLKANEEMLNLLLRKVGQEKCREILENLQDDIGHREVIGFADDAETLNEKNLARKINFTFFPDK